MRDTERLKNAKESLFAFGYIGICAIEVEEERIETIYSPMERLYTKPEETNSLHRRTAKSVKAKLGTTLPGVECPGLSKVEKPRWRKSRKPFTLDQQYPGLRHEV